MSHQSMSHPPMYPLLFEPIYKEKVWGGRNLEALGRSLPGGPGNLIGESWELVDLGTTMASGGGGGSERSVIANGQLAGQTIHDVMKSCGQDFMGDLPPSDFGEFPLLVKFLDANDNLSVQVHPSEAYAEEHSDAYLKSEAWYIVDAEPDACIYVGIQEGVTPQRFREAIETNTIEAVEPLLIKVPVKPGDCHYLPSGTCHALGAGIVVAEVQTPSDTTFRVFDWGRKGRELHVEEAMQCIHFGPGEGGQWQPMTTVRRAEAQGEVVSTKLVSCEHFAMELVELPAGLSMDVKPGEPIVWMMLEGGGAFDCEPGIQTALPPGRTALLPPGMHAGRFTADAACRYIEVTFPQAESESIA